MSLPNLCLRLNTIIDIDKSKCWRWDGYLDENYSTLYSFEREMMICCCRSDKVWRQVIFLVMCCRREFFFSFEEEQKSKWLWDEEDDTTMKTRLKRIKDHFLGGETVMNKSKGITYNWTRKETETRGMNIPIDWLEIQRWSFVFSL